MDRWCVAIVRMAPDSRWWRCRSFKIEGREDVAVHHEERVIQPVDQLERGGCSQGRLSWTYLSFTVRVHALVEHRAKVVRQVADAKRDIHRPAASRSTTISRIARSPTGISGLGRTDVYGARRVPRPPAKMTAFFLIRTFPFSPRSRCRPRPSA